MRSAAIVLMIILQCPAISTAQTTSESTLTSLTLDTAVRQALENHPALGVARARVVIASARLLGSKSSYYPQIDANGIAKVGLSGASNGLGLKGLPASPFYRNLADSLNVYQNLHDFGRTARSVEEKKALLRSAEEELLATSAGIIANVYRAYFGLLQKQNVLEIARKSQNDRELTLRQAGAFFRAGLKSRLDLDLAQLNLDRARLRVLEGENDVARSQSELRAALGIVSRVEFAPVDDRQVGPPPALLEELVARSLVERPELKAAAARSAAAEAVLELARSEARPRLAAVFSGGYARFTEVLARQLLLGAVGLAVPVFTGFYLRSRVQESEAALQITKSQEETAAIDIVLEVSRAYYAVLDQRARVEMQNSALEHAERARRLAQNRYRARLASFLELNAAETNQAEAESGYLESIYNLKMAEAGLRFLTGDLRVQ